MATHLVLLPILIPLSGVPVALLLRRRHGVQAGWSLGVMLTSLAASLWLLAAVWSSGRPVVFEAGGWPAPFGIVIIGDLLGVFFVVMAQLIVVLGIVYALGSGDVVVRFPAFYALFLALAVGLSGAFLTGDLFNLYVFAELLLISGAVLAAASDHRLGAEAAYKYFYLSLLASFFMLLAIGALYVSYGTLNMADLAQRVQAQGSVRLLWPGIALLLAAFMVKSAVFPFHFWQPDLYSAAPTAVAAVLAGVVGKVGVYGFLRMNTLLFVDQAPQVHGVLLVLGVVGVVFGGLSALGTHDLKRMLAYSSMAQIGFIVVAIAWGTAPALATALVFAFNHSVIKAAMIMLAGYVASRRPGRSTAFDSMTGLGKAVPVAGMLFFVGGLALAGVPPTNGFISKALLFSSGLDGAHYGSLLVVGVASLLTLIYVMRAFMRIWWRPPTAAIEPGPAVAGDRLLAPALLVILALVLGLWAQPLVQLAGDTATWLSEPAAYIAAVLGG